VGAPSLRLLQGWAAMLPMGFASNGVTRPPFAKSTRRMGHPLHSGASGRLCHGGWATLTGKYNAGLSLNVDRITGGAPLLALFEKWPAEPSPPFDSVLRGRRSDLHPIKHIPPAKNTQTKAPQTHRVMGRPSQCGFQDCTSGDELFPLLHRVRIPVDDMNKRIGIHREAD
jgi:hypothetical protein